MYKFTVENYKCFKDMVTIDKPELVNLIIGRNNSGKTSLISCIELIYSKTIPIETPINHNSVEFNIFLPLDDDLVKECYSENNSTLIDSVSLSDYDKFKSFGIEEILVLTKVQNRRLECIGSENTFLEFDIVNNISFFKNSSCWKSLTKKQFSRMTKYYFHKISSERDIKPEIRDLRSNIKPNGDGVTSLIDKFINVDGNDYTLIKKTLLDDINKILIGEDKYDDIGVSYESERSEGHIYLSVEGTRIKLSDMGSGLKTIILTLLMLHVYNNEKGPHIFAFEELENNLHPEIQRRLFNYIYEFCIEHNHHVFITSHSHVAINSFFGRINTSIYHIEKKGNGISDIKKIDSYIEKVNVLDDLGVKASDIFQTNGIIWVEGPSDRVYIKKWIRLLDDQLEENIDYSFLYYGGKILSHYSADELENFIRILLINRNGIIVMDSDIKEDGEEINETKQRIQKEFKEHEMLFWITKGREIENYLSKDDLNKKHNCKELEQIGQYDSYADYINKYDPNFRDHKVEYSNSVEMTSESLEILDLRDRITEIINKIKKWNNK